MAAQTDISRECSGADSCFPPLGPLEKQGDALCPKPIKGLSGAEVSCLWCTSRLKAALSITSAGGLLSLLHVRLEAGIISRTCNHTGDRAMSICVRGMHA